MLLIYYYYKWDSLLCLFIGAMRACMPLHKSRGQGTPCKGQFSLSTLWGPEMEAQVAREQGPHKTSLQTDTFVTSTPSHLVPTL